MSPFSIDVVLAGETLQPHAGRALWWPARRTLIVADVHLGKGAAFRRAGIAVPSGSTHETLERLGSLLSETLATRLLILGDLFHTKLAAAEPTRQSFDVFRAQHAALEIVAIRGNHDRGLEDLPAEWRIGWHKQSLRETPFVFTHEPQPDKRGYVLAGHVHPVVRLRGQAGSLRLPAFLFGKDVGVLPSFGAFTGGHLVEPSSRDQIIGVTPDGLVSLPRKTDRPASFTK